MKQRVGFYRSFSPHPIRVSSIASRRILICHRVRWPTFGSVSNLDPASPRKLKFIRNIKVDQKRPLSTKSHVITSVPFVVNINLIKRREFWFRIICRSVFTTTYIPFNLNTTFVLVQEILHYCSLHSPARTFHFID